MTSIVLNQFGGIAPIMDRSKLPAPHGQTAENCLFEGGNLRALRVPEALNIVYDSQTSVVRSLFRLSELQWFKWYGDVAAVRGPTTIEKNFSGLGDDYRVYFAGDTGDSPTWPRWTTKYRGMGSANPSSFFEAPAVTYPLGVPAPQSVPTVASGAAPTNIFTAMRKGNPIQCESLTPHNFANGNRVRVSGMPSSGDGSELNNNQYAVSVVNATTFKLDSADGSEWSGDVFGGFTATRVYSDAELEDRLYVYTYVNEFGEEGAPSEPSSMISIGDGQSVTVGMDTGATITIGSGPAFTVQKKRIYRTVTGSNDADYQFVTEVLISAATYADSIDFASLGEIIQTETYELPPADLKGLVSHPNGFLVGFDANKLYASEPYLPYAWPSDYIKTMESETIIALAIYGSTIVILTDSSPYLAPCTDPASISPRNADQVFPCVGRQAVVSTGYSVVYVSPVGLISFDASGPRNVTERYYSSAQWRTIIGHASAADVTLAYQDSRVWMLCTSGLYCFDMREAGQLNITTHPLEGSTLATHPEDDALYVMYGNISTESTRRLYTYNGSYGDYLTYTWVGPRTQLRRELCFARMQAFAEEYDGVDRDLAINLSHRTPVVDGDPEVADTTESLTVSSKVPRVLSSGFTSDEWTVEVVGNVDLKAIHIAESIDELEEIAL